LYSFTEGCVDLLPGMPIIPDPATNNSRTCLPLFVVRENATHITQSVWTQQSLVRIQRGTRLKAQGAGKKLCLLSPYALSKSAIRNPKFAMLFYAPCFFFCNGLLIRHRRNNGRCYQVYRLRFTTFLISFWPIHLFRFVSSSMSSKFTW